MKLYIAAKYLPQQRERNIALETVIAWVTEQHHSITYRWWEDRLERPFYENRAVNFPFVERMRDGVKDADALVLIVEDGLMGGWVEFGIAIADLMPIVVIGPKPDGHPGRSTLEGSRRTSAFELFPCVRHAAVKPELIEALNTIESQLPHRRGSGAPIMIDQDLDANVYADDGDEDGDDANDREPLIEHTEGAE